MKAKLDGVHPVLASNDVSGSLEFYARLGFAVVFQDSPSSPKYAVIRRDDVELHIQWAAADQWVPAIDRPVYRFIVSDVDALYAEFAAASALNESDNRSPWARPADTPWGTREFHMRDPWQNGLQFYRLRNA